MVDLTQQQLRQQNIRNIAQRKAVAISQFNAEIQKPQEVIQQPSPEAAVEVQQAASTESAYDKVMKKVEMYRKRMNNATNETSAWENEVYVGYLEQSADMARSGMYDPEDLINYASDRAQAKIGRYEYEKNIVAPAQKKYQEDVKKYNESVTQQGTVIVGGQGYSVPVEKQKEFIESFGKPVQPKTSVPSFMQQEPKQLNIKEYVTQSHPKIEKPTTLQKASMGLAGVYGGLSKGTEKLGGVIAKIPIPKPYPSSKRYTNIGAISSLGMSSIGWTSKNAPIRVEKIYSKFASPTYITKEKNIPVYQKESLMGEPGKKTTSTNIFIPGGVTKEKESLSLLKAGAEIAPQTILWTPPGAAMSIISSSYKKEPVKPMDIFILGTYGAGKVIKPVTQFFTKPLVTERLAGKTMEGVKEVSFVAPEGKAATYDIFKYTPATEVRVTTKAREALGMKPKIEWTPINYPKINVYSPKLSKEGGYLGTKYLIKGNEPYLLESVKIRNAPMNLNKAKEVIKIVDTGEKGVRKYSLIGGNSRIVKELPSGAQVSESALGKITFGKPSGKTMQRFYSVTGTIPKEAQLENAPVKFYRFMTSTKETTFPFYKKIGYKKLAGELAEFNVERLPSLTKNKIEFFPLQEESLMKANAPSTVKLGAQEQIQITKQLPKVLEKPSSKTLFPAARTPLKLVQLRNTKGVSLKGIPRMVGGLGLTGEQISSVSYLPVPAEEVAGINLPAKAKEEQVDLGINIPKTRNVQLTGLASVSIPRLKDITKLSIGLKPSQIELTKPKEALKMFEGLKTQQKVEQKIVQKTKLQQAQTPKTSLRVSNIMKPPRVPKTPPTRLKTPINLGGSSLLKSALSKLSPGYKTLIKRRGKWEQLLGVSTKSEAIRKGERQALQTLRASFKIEPANVGVIGKEERYSPSRIFRTYKIRGKQRIPLINEWIQQAPFRLSSKGERTEIISAKRKKLKLKWF